MLAKLGPALPHGGGREESSDLSLNSVPDMPRFVMAMFLHRSGVNIAL